ncbi:uncharacterized protein, partial [Triticum aestivum]
MDIVPGTSSSDVVGAPDVASTYPVCCTQDPNYHNNRLWNYPDGHPLLEETPSFDLGIVTPPCNKSKGPSMVSIATMRDITRRDLFGAGDFGMCTPGSANLVTPATPFHISSASLEATQQRQIVHNVSPVSCTRSVATGLLDFREEVEADCVNLNKPVGEHSLSAPPPKRRVVPGPAGRSPFVMQYRLSERASGNATHLYLVFSQMSGAVLSKESSRIVALHYARQWMGTKLQRTLSPIGDEFDQSRMILLYEVLGLAGNIGQLPAKFK